MKRGAIMKTEEDVYQFYQATLMPELEKLENIRQKNKKNFSIFRIAFAILCAALFWGMIKFFTMEIYTAAIASIALFLIGCHFANPSDEYDLGFKSKIIKKLVHFLDESLIYEPDQ